MGNIVEFRNKILDAYKPNRFSVTIQHPASGFDGTEELLIKSTTVPPLDISTIDLPYRLRKISIPGSRQKQDWTATFYASNETYYKFTQWANLCSPLKFDDDAGDIGGLEAIRAEIEIKIEKTSFPVGDSESSIPGPFNKSVAESDTPEKPMLNIKIANAWPKNVSSLDLSMDSRDSLLEFNVTFEYEFVEYEKGS